MGRNFGDATVTPFEALRMGGGIPAPQVNIYDLVVKTRDTGAPEAYWQLGSDGTGTYSTLGGSTSTWTWLLSGLNSDYQVRATLVSGPTPSGTLGSWLGLGTTRKWGNSDTTANTVLTIEVRRVADSVIIDTASITLNYIDFVGGGGGGP